MVKRELTKMMKQIMKRAWEIAKDGVKKFGGKVREYFAESLKLAWVQIANERGAIGNAPQVIEQTWTTSKGTQIVYKYTTEEVVELSVDGMVYGTKIEKGVFPQFLSVNGEEVKSFRAKRKRKEHTLELGAVEFRGKMYNMEIEMPEEVSFEIYGPFKKSPWILDGNKETKNTLQCKHCGEYCYSDCQSNK